MNRRAILCLALGITCAPLLCAQAAESASRTNVVYHLSEGLPQASRALRQIRNHLRADANTKIVVVALANGVDFLLLDAVDAGNYPYELLVQPLAAEGVEFRVCQNTLDSRLIKREQLLEDAKLVPSGVAELARLQARDGYAYIKP